MDLDSIIKRLAAAKQLQREKYQQFFGRRVVSGSEILQFVDINDTGCPYFSRVVKGKVQKKLYTLAIGREWLEAQVQLTH